jgi:hypothetical protein
MNEETEKARAELIDAGLASIMELCGELNLKPNGTIIMQFRLVLFGVVQMSHAPLEARIAALEAKSWLVGVDTTKPSDKEFKP